MAFWNRLLTMVKTSKPLRLDTIAKPIIEAVGGATLLWGLKSWGPEQVMHQEKSFKELHQPRNKSHRASDAQSEEEGPHTFQ